MKGLKKLALASAVLAVSTGAFAMEAMQDDALANTTGQDGLSILQTGLSVTIDALRYTDSDGIAPAASAGNLNISDNNPLHTLTSGPCAGDTPAVCATSFASLGTLQISDLQISANSILTTIDVGSTSTGATGVTGLLIGTKVNGLSISLGAISFDNGNELAATPTFTGAVTDTAANAGAGTNIGGLSLDNLNVPASSAMLITAGTAAFGTSGITITNLIPITYFGVDVNYYNTNLTTRTGPDTFTSTDGLVTLPIAAYGILQGPIQIAAGATSAGYNITNTEGLEIKLGDTYVSYLDIGNQANVAASFGVAGVTQSTAGIQVAGTTIGSVGIIGLHVATTQLNISGH